MKFKPTPENIKTLGSIKRFYAEKYKITKGNTGASLRFDDASKTQASFLKDIIRDRSAIREYAGKQEYKELSRKIEDHYDISEDEDVSKQLGNIIFQNILHETHKKAIEKKIGTMDETVVKTYDYKQIVPIMDIKNGEVAMFNMETKTTVSDLTYTAYKEWHAKQTKETRDLYNMKFSPAKVSYNPLVSGGYSHIKTEDNQTVIEVNSHTMPTWREKEISNPVLPQQWVELMDHLFPNKKCRDYINVWIYHMLDSRCPIHLLLHSHRGVGKNTLVYILEKLIGSSNYYYVPKTFWDNPFNFELRHKRLLYLDEHKIDSRVNEAELKQYHEPMMVYHKKNVPIEGLEKNHASHIISNNTEVTNHLVYESRRYSVPEITHIPIMEAIGQDKIEELYRLKNDQEFLGNIGWWILQNAKVDEFPREQPYKSQLFYDIVDKALFPWQKWILDTIKSRSNDFYEIENNEDLKYNNKKIGRVQIENFLTSHKDKDGNRYGQLKQVRDVGRVIVPTEAYLPVAEGEVEETSENGDISNINIDEYGF